VSAVGTIHHGDVPTTLRLTVCHSSNIHPHALRSLSKVNIYLLGQQIISLEKAFIKEGGLRERMTNARLQHRNKINLTKLFWWDS
jgi:four helix bundle suffix protein